MLLRTATGADLPGLLATQEEGALAGFAHIFPPATYPYPRAELQAAWEAELTDPAVEVLVAPDADRILAFAALRANELLHFGTAVATWGTGLAATIHDELLPRLAASGSAHAKLHVMTENHRARRFYERHGWQPTGLITREPYPPHPDLIEYRLPLPPAQPPKQANSQ
ncbi:GNAT family N-acetyltransferase [Symbioplanes lichenis]|uniref:GNAT family N-acetyltransferase n=1 Tax=Symbioplanes lichenis TaxID=1629072 RepID=UPI00273818B8|nr:GNAT family N-acetyltransferase [Actinoplanes lichenis]